MLNHHAMNIYGRMAAELRAFLNLTLDGGEWSAYALATLLPGIQSPVPIK
jgi:hypothetical protein